MIVIITSVTYPETENMGERVKLETDETEGEGVRGANEGET